MDDSFERSFRDNLHNKLLLRNKSSTIKQSETEARSVRQASPAQLSSMVDDARVAIEAREWRITVPTRELTAVPHNDDEIIIQGTKQKHWILQEYEDTFGTDYSDSITTKKEGKHSSIVPVRKIVRMKPSIKKYYRVEELTIYNVITTVIKESRNSFSSADLISLSCANKDFLIMIKNTIRWLRIDFSSLRNPRYDYEKQTKICLHRVDMASAAMVHFGSDPGKLVRWLGGEYIGERCDVVLILAAVKDHITEDDYAHMRRIFIDGCPAELQFDEPLSNKLTMIEQGNSKSFNENPELVLKTMNKEDRYSHLLPLHELICKFSANCRHTTQTLVIKPGKNDRLCYDGSTTWLPTNIVINQVTPMENEAQITFGRTKILFLTDIYNTRISFPNVPILLATADIKACFRYARIHADLTGAFGFAAGGYYNLATAMVFGLTISASSWEVYRRAIEAMSAVFANRPDLVIKHRHYLDMIGWAEIDPNV